MIQDTYPVDANMMRTPQLVLLSMVCLLGVPVGCDRSTGKPTNRESSNMKNESSTNSNEDPRATDDLVLPDGFDIQGHRGARGLKPENTLPSFETALDLEVDTLELDLHLSKNGRAIVWHDPWVYESKCRGNDPRMHVHVEPVRRGEEGEHPTIPTRPASHLADFTCDKNPDPERFPEQDDAPTTVAGDNYSIITLDDLLTFVEGYADDPDKSASQRENARRVRFNLETKRNPEHPEYIGDDFDGTAPGELERRIVEVVRKHGLVDRVTVQSFMPESVWAVRQLEPELRFAILEAERSASFRDYADRGADIWSPNADLVDETTLADAHDAGLDVIPWTVNDPDEMRRLIRLGVDGLITDRPDLLVEMRAPDTETK